jgi:hypothetical protein
VVLIVSTLPSTTHGLLTSGGGLLGRDQRQKNRRDRYTVRRAQAFECTRRRSCERRKGDDQCRRRRAGDQYRGGDCEVGVVTTRCSRKRRRLRHYLDQTREVSEARVETEHADLTSPVLQVSLKGRRYLHRQVEGHTSAHQSKRAILEGRFSGVAIPSI